MCKIVSKVHKSRKRAAGCCLRDREANHTVSSDVAKEIASEPVSGGAGGAAPLWLSPCHPVDVETVLPAVPSGQAQPPVPLLPVRAPLSQSPAGCGAANPLASLLGDSVQWQQCPPQPKLIPHRPPAAGGRGPRSRCEQAWCPLTPLLWARRRPPCARVLVRSFLCARAPLVSSYEDTSHTAWP